MPITRIGINGFGCVGRRLFKILWEQYPELQIAAIGAADSTQTGVGMLLQQDQAYGTFAHTLETRSGMLIVDGQNIPIIPQIDAQNARRWGDCDLDLLIDVMGSCQRRFDATGYLQAGIKKVIMTRSAGWADATLMMGINHHLYNAEQHHLISASSCAATGLALISQVLNDNFGLAEGFATLVHPAPFTTQGGERWSGDHPIPTVASVARDLNRVLPKVGPRLTTAILRAPAPHVAMLDFMAHLKQRVTARQVNEIFEQAAANALKDILAVSDALLASTEYVGDPHSAVVDTLSTTTAGQLVRVTAKYDCEWSYACRVAGLTAYIAQQGLTRWTMADLWSGLVETELVSMPQCS